MTRALVLCSFPRRFNARMPDEVPLHPATRDEIATALSFALRFDGRRRFDKGNEIMANITAEHLVKYLEQAGFVVMKKPPMKPHRAG